MENKRFSFKNKWTKALALLFVLIIAEIFVFNFKFFTTLGYKPTQIGQLEAGDNADSTGTFRFKFSDNSGKVEINNVNKEIKNIYIDARNTEFKSGTDFEDIKSREKNKQIKVKLKIDDYSRSGGIEMPERSIISTVERTKYLNLKLKGETKNISLEFKDVKDKEILINSVVINKTVPFHFSVIRVIVLFVIISLLYAVRPSSKLYLYKLNFKEKKQKIIIIAAAVIQIAVMLTAVHTNPMYVYNTVSWQNQYNELADAILDGKYNIEANVDSKLFVLKNPYDPSARESMGVSSNWDHAYYNGKYYVYFGVVPALLFNIPAKLISEKGISAFNCIMIIIPAFVIMSYLLIYALANKFKENKGGISLLIYLIMAEIFANGIGTAFLMAWPDMYSLPIFLAITLVISGLYCWITAFKRKEEDYQLSKPKLIIGSLCMALVAGCRPQLLLTMFLAVPIFWEAVFKDRKLFSKKSVANSVLFVLPIALFALFMFHYNYARFGSPFDFGANYNLTTNDMTSRGFSLGRIPQGLFYYILQPMSITGIFPYIKETPFSTLYMGTTIKEATFGGILFLQPIIWMILFISGVKEDLKKNRLYIFTILMIVFSVIVAAADSVMAGILSRYYLDFSFLLVLPAIIVGFAVYQKYCDSIIFKKYVSVCFVYTLVISFLLMLGVSQYAPANNNPELYWRIASAIQFWM